MRTSVKAFWVAAVVSTIAFASISARAAYFRQDGVGCQRPNVQFNEWVIDCPVPDNNTVPAEQLTWFGVYVDNIGLNGVTLLKGDTERTFFITARKWVPEQTRLFHLRSAEEGNQTSMPVILHVRKGSGTQSPTTNAVAASPDAE